MIWTESGCHPTINVEQTMRETVMGTAEHSKATGRMGGHPGSVVTAHAAVIGASSAVSRFVETADRDRVHVIERGSGEPLVLIHGSGPSALLFLPLMDQLEGVHAIAVDRPGFGLSDPTRRSSGPVRGAAVATLDAILDALDLTEVSLLGNSMGGTWATWYALARPDRVRRLVLVGAPPSLPGTRVPPPMLAVAASPTDGPPPMPRPTSESVVQSMAAMGEADTIVKYPEHIEALVAAAQDQMAGEASLTELRATISPSGWQRAVAMETAELAGLKAPTLMLWGDHDPLGDSEVGRSLAGHLPRAMLQSISGGHAPWLGDPTGVARLISDFLT